MTLQVFAHRVSQGNEQHSGSLASLYYVRSFCHKLHHSDVHTCDTRRLSCNDETEECEVRKIYQKRYCRESILETSTSVSSLVCFKVWKKIKYVQCLVDLFDGMHQYTLELFVPLICKFLCIKIFSKKKIIKISRDQNSQIPQLWRLCWRVVVRQVAVKIPLPQVVPRTFHRISLRLCRFCRRMFFWSDWACAKWR